MAEIIGLHGAAVVERMRDDVNSEVIERLEAALERARAGKLRSFAMVSVEAGGHSATEWCETDGWYHEIVSGMATLQFRFLCDNSGYRPRDDNGA